MEIRTNNQWRDLVCGAELPKAALDGFDWIDDAESDFGFFKYLGVWYHLGDFMRVDSNSPFSDSWHGVCGDTYFSATLIRLSDDGESVICARAYS